MPNEPRFPLRNKRPGDIIYIDASGEEVVLHRPTAASILQHLATDAGPAWLAKTAASSIDHGGLAGLTDVADHPGYVTTDGARDITSGGTTTQEINSTGADAAVGLLLTARRGSVDKTWTLTSRGGADTPNDRLSAFNNAGTERLSLSDAGGLSVNAVVDPGAGVINANTGFRVGNAAASGKVLAGDGTNFVSSDVPSHGASVHTNRTRTLYIDAGALQVGTRAAGAALTSQGSNTRFNAWQLDAAAAEESVLGGFQIPQDYASGFTVKLHMANSGAGSGNVVMLTVVKNAVDGTDLNSTSGESVVQNTFTAGSQNVEKVYTTTVSLSPAAGDYIRLIVGRNGSDAADTLGNDIGLIGVTFEYTADM